MDEQDYATLRRRLLELTEEHRDLDAAVAAMANNPEVDQLRVVRMKKRKLQIKDAISRLESRLIPDLNA